MDKGNRMNCIYLLRSSPEDPIFDNCVFLRSLSDLRVNVQTIAKEELLLSLICPLGGVKNVLYRN